MLNTSGGAGRVKDSTEGHSRQADPKAATARECFSRPPPPPPPYTLSGTETKFSCVSLRAKEEPGTKCWNPGILLVEIQVLHLPQGHKHSSGPVLSV